MKCHLSLYAILTGMALFPILLLAQSSPCGFNAPILDNSCTASSNFPITVSGINGTQLGSDVILQEVRFIISHTWDNDLNIFLRSPSGIWVELSTDNGGGADHYGDPSDNTCTNVTSLRMNACTPIEEGVAPFIGEFLPEGDFADFNDGSDPEGTWTIRICDDAQNDAGYLHFVSLVFAELSCPPVTALAVDTLSGSAAGIEWTTTGTCVNTVLEYGPLGFQPGIGASANEGTVLTLNCPVAMPYMINGLDDLTTYEVYIRTACTNGGYSDNSCLLTFTTLCNTDVITLLENLDTLPPCATTCGAVCPLAGIWFNSPDDDFDWLLHSGETGTANTGPDDDISGGGQYLYNEASGAACRNDNQGILESACLLVNASAGTCHLSFSHHLYGTHIGELQLQISTNGGSNWTTLWNIIGEQGDQWELTYINLSAYHNQLAKFRFISIGGDGIRGDMALDEIAFYGTTLAPANGATFYADLDNDGYGDVNNSLSGCSLTPPSGYVNNALDCDDTTACINPAATEIPCNNIDENCNGFFLQTLPNLSANNHIVCMGETATLTVNGVATGDYYWSDENGNILFTGDTFYTQVLTATTNFWVQDSVVNLCTSLRKKITVTVDPGTAIGTNDQPLICLGQSFDLSSLNIVDANNNVFAISYHSDSPASDMNELSATNVFPVADSVFYLQAATINGCTSELAIEVKVNPRPTAIITVLNNDLIICANELSNLTASEGGTGMGAITYLWEDGSTAPERTIFPSNSPGAATYQVEVTDANGCTDVATIVIHTLPSISGVGVVTTEAVSFCDGNDGLMILNPVDGQAPYIYEWTGPISGSGQSVGGNYTINGLSQGAYRITVTDSYNCQVILPNIIINGPGVVVDAAVAISPASCAGEDNGAIDISITSGAPTYLWSSGATTQDLQNVPAGLYSLTITDGICETILTDLEVTAPAPLQSELLSMQPVSCAAGSDAFIDVHVTGGSEPYSYFWSNNATTQDLTGLTAGEYQLTVVDVNACASISPVFMITAPSALDSEVEQLTEVTCYGGTDAAIQISVSGGVAPYFYEWSNGQLTNQLSDLAAGIYQATVTDANGCTHVGAAVQLQQPEAISIALDSLENPDCNEIANGYIGLDIHGGTAPYSYQWSNNSITKNIANLPEGVYQVSVTDSQSCIAVSEVYEVTAPQVIFLALVIITEESCAGVGDGAIQMQPAGGTQPYSFQWSNGAQTEDLQNLPAGSYQLLITDNNGCTKLSTPLEVAALEPLSATVASLNDVSCAGESDGSIYLNVPSTGQPYTYLWDNGATSPELEGVPPGTYRAQIVANDGCTFYSEHIVIQEPDTLQVEVASVEAPTCNGFFNGSIDVAISGGTAPFTYSWNNGSTAEDLSNASSGTYQMTVIDQNGCITGSGNVLLGEPVMLQLSTQTVGVGCIDSIGSISALVSGGTAPYAYQWSTGDTDATVDALPAGPYGLTLTDANDCLLIHSGLSVPQLVDSLTVFAVADSEVSCYGLSDAALAVQIVGGNYPFQYNWSNGITDSLNQNISAGNYSVTVTDNYGCVGVSDLLTVTMPDAIHFFIENIEGNVCLGDDQGEISIVVSGGQPPYGINWSNGADSTFINQLGTGQYTVTITDQNNCTTVSTQPIYVPGPASSVQAQLVNAGQILCFGDTNSSLAVLPSGGVGGYSYMWNTGATSQSIHNLGSGFYQCTVTDANGCVFVTQNYELEGPLTALGISPGSQIVHNEYCDGMDGSVSIMASGGTAPYTYLWNNNAFTSLIENLPAGTYTCTVTDDHGCVYTTAGFVVEEPENTLEISLQSTPDTNELGNGAAAPLVTGGTWPYTFAWDEGTGFQTDSVATGLAAGVYQLTITDAQDCTITGEVLVDTLTVLGSATGSWEELVAFDCYPNPTGGELQVVMGLDAVVEVEVKLRVYSLVGEEVMVLDMGKVGSVRELLDLGGLEAGVYVLVLEVRDRGRVFKRVVVF